MLRFTLRTGSAFAILVASAGLILAQAQETRSDTMALRAKSVLGAQVSLQGGTSVGTVEDIVFNHDGVIDYLIVSERGKLVTVPWEAAKFNHEKRTAVINITPEKFREIPTYAIDRYPDFYTPTYRVQVYRHFGLTPGQERRLERRQERRP
jgi:sporulation protein YlmC with PRC-barrel domain